MPVVDLGNNCCCGGSSSGSPTSGSPGSPGGGGEGPPGPCGGNRHCYITGLKRTATLHLAAVNIANGCDTCLPGPVRVTGDVVMVQSGSLQTWAGTAPDCSGVQFVSWATPDFVHLGNYCGDDVWCLAGFTLGGDYCADNIGTPPCCCFSRWSLCLYKRIFVAGVPEFRGLASNGEPCGPFGCVCEAFNCSTCVERVASGAIDVTDPNFNSNCPGIIQLGFSCLGNGLPAWRCGQGRIFRFKFLDCDTLGATAAVNGEVSITV